MTEVEVLRRWQGSSVNAHETCGVPDELAEQLAKLDPPAVRIIRKNVPDTQGMKLVDGKLVPDVQINKADILYDLMNELLQEMRAKNRKN